MRNDFPIDLYTHRLPERVADKLRREIPPTVYLYFDASSDTEYWVLPSSEELIQAIEFNLRYVTLTIE